MNEIELFYDPNRETKVNEIIYFEPVPAGEITTKKLYLYNKIEYELDIELKASGVGIEISHKTKLNSKATKEIIFKFSPNITMMKPIKAELKIKIKYTVI